MVVPELSVFRFSTILNLQRVLSVFQILIQRVKPFKFCFCNLFEKTSSSNQGCPSRLYSNCS